MQLLQLLAEEVKEKKEKNVILKLKEKKDKLI